MGMIPEMTDPLGRHWRQPADIRQAPMDDTHVILTRQQFDELPEYTETLPTGAYPGKCWKRRISNTKWLLAWFGDPFFEDGREMLSIGRREIILE